VKHAVWFAAQVATGNGGFAIGGREQRGEHAERGGFAGAVGAEEAENFAGFDPQVNAGNGFDGSGAGAKSAPQGVGLDHNGPSR